MPKSYTSSGFGFFDAWRVWMYSSFVLFFPLKFLFKLGGLESFISAMLIALTLVLVLLFLRVSRISRRANNVACRSLTNVIWIEEVQEVKTWWSYDINGSDIEMEFGEGTEGKSRGISNYIFIFAEIIGNNGSAIIYELIQLSGKFPNNHPYDPKALDEDTPQFKVYDVDKCLDKLQLNTYENK